MELARGGSAGGRGSTTDGNVKEGGADGTKSNTTSCATVVNNSQLIINEPLCYVFKKYGRVDSKTLKKVLFDFYDSETISAAKESLVQAVLELKINLPKSIMRKRRDSKESSDVKITHDIDDLVAIVTHIDEQGGITRLPTFVAADPDRLPSIRLQEGDLLAVMNKLSKMDEKISTVSNSIDATHSLICNRTRQGGAGVSGGGVGSMGRGGGSGRGGGGGKGRIGGAATNVVGYMHPISRLAAEAANNMLSTAQSDSEAPEQDTGDSDWEPWSTVSRSNKRPRQSVSPPTGTAASVSYAGKAGQPASASAVASANKSTVSGRKIMIGQSTSASIKASKNLIVPKSVYRIGNVDACYTADNLKEYLESIGIRVLSCFERTSAKSRFSDNKTFRVCIIDADRTKLMSENNWSVGISISKWVFHPKEDQTMDAASHEVGGTGGVAGAMSGHPSLVGSGVGVVGEVGGGVGEASSVSEF